LPFKLYTFNNQNDRLVLLFNLKALLQSLSKKVY